MKNTFWVFLFLILHGGLAWALPKFRCDRLFYTVPLEFKVDEWGVQANAVEITGEKDYSLKEVLADLKINPKWMKQQALGGKKVLSLAEGISKLLPELVANGVDAFATDLWYFQIKSTDQSLSVMREFENQWKERIFPSDVRYLPLASESVDTILSHKLYNNLHMADILNSVAEIARVLTVDGQARLSDISDVAFKHVEEFLKKNYSGELQWQHQGMLLIIKKKKSIKNEEPKVPYDSNFRYHGIPNGTRTFELPWAEGENDPSQN